MLPFQLVFKASVCYVNNETVNGCSGCSTRRRGSRDVAEAFVRPTDQGMEPMGLTSFKTFHSLPQRFKPQTIGFACEKPGTINRLSARMGLAKSFRGIQLEGYKERTVR